MGLPSGALGDAAMPFTRRQASGRRSRRPAAPTRTFTTSLRALERVAADGAKVSLYVVDLDRDEVVIAGDDFVSYPIGSLGAVPVLVEAAVGIREGRIDPDEPVRREEVTPPSHAGLWGRMRTPRLTVEDLAVLCASVDDPLALNALIARVGLQAVQRRIGMFGFHRLALLDAHRDQRGPDDAPYLAIGTTRELASMMALIVNGHAVDAAISAQVGEWLALNVDLSLVGAATALDPFTHDDDRHQLLFLNKTGRDEGVRCEAGVLAGPRAGVAYALTVCFDDLSPVHRIRVHDAMRVFGVDLMEYVH